MNSKEKDLIDKFIVNIVTHTDRAIVESERFDKKDKSGYSIVIRVKDVVKEFKVLCKKLKGKTPKRSKKNGKSMD